jgi:hypothetical protein
VASDDTGPPADEQPGTAQAAGDTAAETNGHADDGGSGWDPSSGASPDRGPAFPSPSPASFGSPSAAPGDRSSTAYPADSAYSGNTVDDGYGPPGTERTAMHDFPSSSVASQTFGAAPAEDIYGSPDGQREYPASPYPAQVTTPRPQPEPGDGTSSRQAHLMVSRFEPWSVMKFSFMISLACFVILFVAVTLLYGTLAGLGVFDAIQKALSNVTSGQGTGGVNISHWLSASTVLSYTALLGVLNVFLITAFATVGSLVYNLTAHLIGGVEVTLRETE